ncbi:MAG: ATP-binding protein [Cyclobacteriaceae bacterium]
MKVVRDQIYQLIQSPDRANIREHLQNTIGETDNVDYKVDFNNYAKLSRHILAIANTGGGLIIVGVAQSRETGQIDPIGLDRFVDKADIYKGIQKYVPNYLEFDVLDFEYTESEYEKLKGKKIQVISIKYEPKYIPFISIKAGEGILENKIYVRKGTQSIEPSYEDLQKIVNKRIETEFVNANTIGLDEHLKQLKILYGQLNKFNHSNPIWSDLHVTIMGGVKTPNFAYPKEDYDDFIAAMIEAKKDIIRRIVKRI